MEEDNPGQQVSTGTTHTPVPWEPEYRLERHDCRVPEITSAIWRRVQSGDGLTDGGGS